LYVVLSTKQTLEKIKQSLRFQVDRRQEQQKDSLQACPSGQPTRPHTTIKVSPPFHKDGHVRKRTAMDAGLLQVLACSGGCPKLPPKKRVVSLGAFGIMRSSAEGPFLLPIHRTPPAASSVTSYSGDPTKKLLEKSRARQDPSLSGLVTNHGIGDSLMWPPSRLPAGQLTRILSHSRPSYGNLPEEALVTLERLQQLQNQELQVQERTKFPALWNTMIALKGHEAPTSSLSTPSSLRNTTQLEALSRLLVQEQLDAEFASSIRQQQELEMATLLLEHRQKGNSLASGLSVIGSLLWPNPK
jgi:hypothetical protein